MLRNELVSHCISTKSFVCHTHHQNSVSLSSSPNPTIESNKKRKLREKEYSKDQQKYYKNLRKGQKKRRKERKRLQQEIEQNESKVSRRPTIDLSRAATEGTKKRKLEDSEKNLPRGKRMVSASLKTGKVMQSKKKGEKPSQRQILVPVVKKPKERSNLNELAAENLIRDKGAWSIGIGTFRTCYLGNIVAFLW